MKNEEKTLPRSIESLQGNFDELIVVDTGSTDKTVEVAKKYGASVYDYVWQGDFSAARNYALANAQGDWILFFDADEYYESGGSVRAYLEYLQHSGTDIDAVIINLYNLDSPQLPAMKVIRMFRNHPSIRYAGAVHEQIVRQDGHLHTLLAEQFKFMHTGYAIEAMPIKLRRNLDLIEADIARNGERDSYYYYLAECHFGLQHYPQALEYIAKALESPVKYPYELANYYHILLESMRQCNYPAKEMEKICNIAISLFPDMPEFYGEQGMIVSSMGRLEEALKLFSKCIACYHSPQRQNNHYGYFDDKVMEIVDTRITQIHELLEGGR
ncbi:glycosyltransferase family 2 protein [Selenomonas ruminantium]|uniref:glycosyltransferase family 2 protein n=1 Tax=Selenomonas ruminantium TaxID=971 RepID=UPI001C432586|nr:glycosyltransferase family 2 protein [Selenomonas ruminantium]